MKNYWTEILEFPAVWTGESPTSAAFQEIRWSEIKGNDMIINLGIVCR